MFAKIGKLDKTANPRIKNNKIKIACGRVTSEATEKGKGSFE